MKRLITIILVLSIVLSTGLVSFAEEVYPTPTGDLYAHVEEAIEVEAKDSGYISQFFNSSEQSFEDYIVEKCLAQEAKIDISSFNIPYEDLANKYFDVIFRHPELMVAPSVLPYVSGDITVKIEPFYFFKTVEEAAEARKQLEDKIDEYVQFAQSAPDDLGKLLLVHDKIAYDYYYDDDYLVERENGDYFAYHPYGFILRNKAVCQGYALLLYAVVTRLGIESDYCKSDAINHIWNYIKFDGEWYHVDLTWDDPTLYDNEEKTQLTKTAYHKYFMRSDEDFASGNHGELANYERYGGDLYECTSTKFEKNHLFNFASLYVISYTNGSYKLPHDSEIVFEYPTLYTGPMLVAKPFDSVGPDGVTPFNRLAFAHTGNTGREFMFIRSRTKDGVTAFRTDFMTTDNYIHLFNINKDGAEYSFYFFDRTSLAPLSVRKAVIDN